MAKMEWIKSWDSRKSLNILDIKRGASTAAIKESCLLLGLKYFHETGKSEVDAHDKEFEQIVYACYFLLKNYDCTECSDRTCSHCSSTASLIVEYDIAIESLAVCEEEKEKISDISKTLYYSFLREYVTTHLFEELSEKASLWELYKTLTVCEEKKKATCPQALPKKKRQRRKQHKESSSQGKNPQEETGSSSPKKCAQGAAEKISTQHPVVLPFTSISAESWNEIENQRREAERRKVEFEKEVKEQEKRMKIKEKKMKRKAKKKALAVIEAPDNSDLNSNAVHDSKADQNDFGCANTRSSPGSKLKVSHDASLSLRSTSDDKISDASMELGVPNSGNRRCHFTLDDFPRVHTETPCPDMQTKTFCPDMQTKTPCLDMQTKTPCLDMQTKTPCPDMQTKTPCPDMQTKTPCPDMQTKTPCPDMQTKTSCPDMQTKTPCPDMQTKTSCPDMQTKTPCPDMQTKTPCLDMQTKTPCPDMQTKTSCPDMQTKTPCPDMKTKTFCPDMKTKTFCPDMKTETSCPNDHTKTSCPDMKTETSCPNDHTKTLAERSQERHTDREDEHRHGGMKSASLRKHLDAYFELMKVQPRRHTTQQIRAEQRRLHEQAVANQTAELAEIRKTDASLMAADVISGSRRAEFLQKLRDKEAARNREEEMELKKSGASADENVVGQENKQCKTGTSGDPSKGQQRFANEGSALLLNSGSNTDRSARMPLPLRPLNTDNLPGKNLVGSRKQPSTFDQGLPSAKYCPLSQKESGIDRAVQIQPAVDEALQVQPLVNRQKRSQDQSQDSSVEHLVPIAQRMKEKKVLDMCFQGFKSESLKQAPAISASHLSTKEHVDLSSSKFRVKPPVHWSLEGKRPRSEIQDTDLVPPKSTQAVDKSVAKVCQWMKSVSEQEPHVEIDDFVETKDESEDVIGLHQDCVPDSWEMLCTDDDTDSTASIPCTASPTKLNADHLLKAKSQTEFPKKSYGSEADMIGHFKSEQATKQVENCGADMMRNEFHKSMLESDRGGDRIASKLRTEQEQRKERSKDQSGQVNKLTNKTASALAADMGNAANSRRALGISGPEIMLGTSGPEVMSGSQFSLLSSMPSLPCANPGNSEDWRLKAKALQEIQQQLLLQACQLQSQIMMLGASSVTPTCSTGAASAASAPGNSTKDWSLIGNAVFSNNNNGGWKQGRPAAKEDQPVKFPSLTLTPGDSHVYQSSSTAVAAECLGDKELEEVLKKLPALSSPQENTWGSSLGHRQEADSLTSGILSEEKLCEVLSQVSLKEFDEVEQWADSSYETPIPDLVKVKPKVTRRPGCLLSQRSLKGRESVPYSSQLSRGENGCEFANGDLRTTINERRSYNLSRPKSQVRESLEEVICKQRENECIPLRKPKTKAKCSADMLVQNMKNDHPKNPSGSCVERNRIRCGEIEARRVSSDVAPPARRRGNCPVKPYALARAALSDLLPKNREANLRHDQTKADESPAHALAALPKRFEFKTLDKFPRFNVAE